MARNYEKCSERKRGGAMSDARAMSDERMDAVRSSCYVSKRGSSRRAGGLLAIASRQSSKEANGEGGSRPWPWPWESADHSKLLGGGAFGRAG